MDVLEDSPCSLQGALQGDPGSERVGWVWLAPGSFSGLFDIVRIANAGRDECALVHPNSGLPEFGTLSRPKSDQSDFGWASA